MENQRRQGHEIFRLFYCVPYRADFSFRSFQQDSSPEFRSLDFVDRDIALSGGFIVSCS